MGKSLPWQVILAESVPAEWQKGWRGWRAKRGSERLSMMETTEGSKNPGPVSGSGPSTPRGLFHPNANTVVCASCVMISAILNLG
jgi:hypothetical protein